jgi:3-methyladenine DNA glycosylase AlkD
LSTDYGKIIKELKSKANPKNVAGMARFGINAKNTLGVAIPVLRQIAKQNGKSHKLAIELWNSGIHEARILGSMIDEAEKVTEKQMDAWTKDFDSWDVCDQVCMNLFCQTKFAYNKCNHWAKQKEEFVRRAGFALMACLAFKDKKSDDEKFKKFFVVIKKYSIDQRNYVRKAVNWALRQIGKRNTALNRLSIIEATKIAKLNSKSARWIATDAIRELESKAVQRRLKSIH